MDFDESLPSVHRLVLVVEIVRLATRETRLQDPLPLVFRAWEAWQGAPPESGLVPPGVGGVSSLTTDVPSVTDVVVRSSGPVAPGVGGVSGLTPEISLWCPCARSRNPPIYLPRADASFRS